MPKPVTLNPTSRTIALSAVKTRSGDIIRESKKTMNLPSLAEVEDMTNPAHVTTELSITKNMANFESMKIGVFIQSPCLCTDEAKLATHEHDLSLGMKMLEKEAALVSGEWF